MGFLCRHVLNTEDVNNSLVMIQPTLMSYEIDQEPQPALLDSVSIKSDGMLLLDTFFHILIHSGSTVAAWRKAGYHEQDEYAGLAAMMKRPEEDAKVRKTPSFSASSLWRIGH
jgi:protein transport protein SEC23